MRVAIVDDREDDLEQLRGDVCRWAGDRNLPLAVTLFRSGEALLEGFAAGRYDVVLMDIYLDGMTGMETARRLREWDSACQLVFATVTADFAVDSYEVGAAFYLVKPYTYEKLCQALDRCGKQKREEAVALPDGRRIWLNQIAYTEYHGRCVLITCTGGEQVTAAMRQTDFAALLLPYPQFCDCMRGILVNFEVVDKLLEDRFLMKDGKSIPISRLKYREVRERFLDYLYRQARGEDFGCPVFRS